MKKTIITLLATAALAAPAFAANNAATQPQQQPQSQQQSQAQPQNGQQQNGQQQNQNQASNQQPGSTQNLNRGQVRQMQSALDKKGFNAGRPDGRMGPRTTRAVQAFNQKQGIQSQNGKPTEQTLAQLGINTNQGQNQQPNNNQQQPSGNQQQPTQNGQNSQ
jgi:peptidoglycan hydrolase-like protein with peptidoglycan-binding domain